MSKAVHLQPSLLGCPLSSLPEISNLQLLPLPAQAQSIKTQDAEQPLTYRAGARANEQTHKGGLLATRGERKGGENCCQLVCVRLGWHFQPCNCCIMNLAMEFKSYDSFRPKNMSQPPKNHEMLKLYTFNFSLTNPKEQCNSRVPQHNSKHHANIPAPPPSQRKTRAAREQHRGRPLRIIYTCHLCPAQVIGPSSEKGT